ncbi:hypothetical protein SteCoe_7686 [Stentor coeruleus]|uniref:VWFA domain-containing protein n=1 Tax=Stentor coeruleus TaxID=5963 RepID=A0A1R2CLW2_9CILI|nr:hypothetical protein SteCoe_7686 [Stentor coeruleus]
MAKDLRTRVTLAIIIPLILGMLIIAAVSCVPMYIEYRNYIKSYDKHMMSNEKHTMTQLGKVLATRESYGVLFLSAALAQLSANLIIYYSYGRIANGTLGPQTIYSLESNWNNTFNAGYAYSEDDSNKYNQDKYFLTSSYLYYLIQPIGMIEKMYPKFKITPHITFDNGYFAYYPSSEMDFNKVKNESDWKNATRSLWWNTSLTYLNYQQLVSWLPSSLTNQSMVCRSVSLSPSSISKSQSILPCISFSLDSVKDLQLSLKTGRYETFYISDSNCTIYTPIKNTNINFCEENFNFDCHDCNCSHNETQTPNKIISESSRSLVYPLLKDTYQEPEENMIDLADALSDHNGKINTALEYTISKSDTYVMTISPLNISLPLLQDSTKYFSIALKNKKNSMSQSFNELTKKLNSTTMTEICVFSAILLILIILVCTLSYKATSQVIAPIDDLLNILKRLHHDLGVDVKSHAKRGPPEIIDLYEVFDRLRIILRFEDSQLFQDSTYAMMNYAQALKLFHSFNNQKAKEVCFEEMGNIHMSAGRFMEAAMNYLSSLHIAEEDPTSTSKDLAKKRMNTAKAMILSNAKIQRAKEFFLEAIHYYDSQENSIRIEAYIEYIECMLIINQDVENNMMTLKDLLQKSNDTTESSIFLQKFYYLKGLQAYNIKNYKIAGELITESLENFPYFDRITREKSLKLLEKIFSKLKISNIQVAALKKAMEPSPKDVVVAIDSKIGGAVNDEMLTQAINYMVGPMDRVSFLQFDENCQILCNLTKLPRKRCSTCSSIFDLRNICVLNDAIEAGITQISCLKSLIPQSFLSNELERKEWIIVITHGEDIGSNTTHKKLLRKLYKSSCSLVIVAVTPDEQAVSKLRQLVEVTPNGLLIMINDFSDIESGLLEAAAYVSPSKDIFV